jgi:hypothetical protein
LLRGREPAGKEHARLKTCLHCAYQRTPVCSQAQAVECQPPAKQWLIFTARAVCRFPPDTAGGTSL